MRMSSWRHRFSSGSAALSAAVVVAVIVSAALAPGSAAQAPPTKAHVRRGGTLHVVDGGIEFQLTFKRQQSGFMQWAFSPVYDTLLTYRARTYNDMELAPNLVKEWSVSADGETVTLKVQEGVRWQNIPPVNGREFTSEDIRWNAEHYVKDSAYKYLWDAVASIETPDKHTAIIRLKAPDAPFIKNLAHRNNNIFPREVFERDGDFTKVAIGTGPFIVKEFVPKEKLVLVRNPDYWRKSPIDGKPLPYLDSIVSVPINDYQARNAAMLSGQIDQSFAGQLYTPDVVKKFTEKGWLRVDGRLPLTRNLMMNQDDPLWRDVRVRRAASLAIDRQGFIDVVLQGLGYWQDYVPIPGWSWDEKTIKQRFPRDVAKARRLLRQAGKLGAQVVISTYQTGVAGLNTKAAEFVAGNLEEAGFDVKLDVVTDWATFLSTRLAPAKWQTMIMVHGSNGTDPDDYLGVLASDLPPGTNYARVRDPKVDEMIKAQRGAVDPQRRKQLVNQIQDYLHQQMLFAPIAQPKVVGFRNPKLEGPSTVHASSHAIGIDEVWISQ